MKRHGSGRKYVNELARIKRLFDPVTANRKLELVQRLQRATLSSAKDLESYHDSLCFIRAFPDSETLFFAAHSALTVFEQRAAKLSKHAREPLWDSGIAGTPVHYPFSYVVAEWLAEHAPGEVSIDWQEVADDTTRLDELLVPFLLPVEADYFDSGYISSEEWVHLVSASATGTDFDWLLAQIRARRSAQVLAQLYESADLPLVWQLGNSRYSTSKNVLPLARVCARGGLRKTGRNTKAEILRPLRSVPRLPRFEGRRLINIAMAALAVRHRETLHFNYANPAEVFLADVGQGVSIAVFGLRAAFRYPLECTMGYLILSNGVPIGYGGASLMYRQANTGVNIFDEYRGGEAACLWLQVMRVYHHLTGCTRFIANPYQFGAENDEALQSGAYWFYYRLGYRSVSPDIRKLAANEYEKLRRDKTRRSSLATLRRLASCDMHLTLPGALLSELFPEDGFETASMLATEVLGAAGGRTRAQAETLVAAQACRDLGIRNFSAWTRQEQAAFRQLAPVLIALDVASWPRSEKRRTRKLARAKGASLESRYAKLLSQHKFLFSRLRTACR